MWLKCLVGIGLLQVVFAHFVSAEPLRAGPVYTDHPGEVSVVVEFELPPEGIPKYDFRLVADGETITAARDIRPFKDSDRGLALIICVDVSGTMAGSPLDETKEVLLSLLPKIEPEDHIALISFADEEEIESPFVDTREQFAEAVRRLQPRGELTKLYQTLYKVLDMFEGAQLPKRRRIIVISDGKDEGSAESIRSVINQATGLNVPIDTIGRGKIERQYAESLQPLASETGGTFTHARPDLLALSDALERLYRGLSETRSFVVSFAYERDEEGQMIEAAAIAVQRPGDEPLLKANISDEIPRPRPPGEPPPPPYLFWLFWLLLAALLGVILLVWLRRHNQKKDGVAPQPQPLPQPDPDDFGVAPQPQPLSQPDPGGPDPQPPRDRTVVGGYYFPMPQPGQPAAILTAVSGSLAGQQFLVEQEIFHIGVSPDSDLCLAEDDYVSEYHAYLRCEHGSLFIFDQGSKNGTSVNQTPVPASGLALSLGDHIRIGASTFEVVKTSS